METLRKRLAEADNASLASGAGGGGPGALVMVRKVRALESQLVDVQRELAAAKAKANVIGASARGVGGVQVEALRQQLEEARRAAAEEAKAREMERVEQVRYTWFTDAGLLHSPDECFSTVISNVVSV